MFGNLYSGEFKKQFNLKTVIIMLVIVLAILVILAAVFDSVNEALVEIGNGNFGMTAGGDTVTSGPDEVTGDAWNYDEASVTAAIEQCKAAIELLEAQKEEDGYSYYRNADTLYYMRGRLALLEYVRDNELYGRDLAVYSGGTVTGLDTMSVTADAFLVMAIGAMVFLVTIYGAIAAGSSYADEYKQGTIKLVLLRPVSRNALTGAKLLAALTHVTAAYTVCFALSAIAAYAVFPVSHADTLYMFNNGAITVADSSAQIGIAFACYYVDVLAYTAVAFAVGTLTRNKVLGIVTPVILVNVLGSIFNISGLGRFFIYDSANWLKFAGLGSSLIGGSNFFISLAVTAVYVGGLTAATFVAVKKKDVA